MKIGVDAGCLAIEDKRLKVGVYRVAFNLLWELGKLDKKNEYLLFSFRPLKKEVLRVFGRHFKNIVCGPKKGWRYFALPKALYLNKVDIFLGPSQALPYFCPCPSLVIIHDLAFEHYPECYPESYKQLRRVTLEAVRKARKIIAVSQKTKRDLIKFYRVPKEKIAVVYEGVSSHFKPVKVKKPAVSYFLFVGALKRIKNIPFLLKGFRRFLNETKSDFQLFLVGGNLWLDPEIPKKIEQFKLEKKVRLLGFVPERKLPALYSGAVAFVSPSLYEGFGLTFLEAMACGCPVIAGNSGAQPEVIRNAGILVNPKDSGEISKAMMKIVSNKRFRQKLVLAGKNQAKKFSWKKFAKEIAEEIKRYSFLAVRNTI